MNRQQKTWVLSGAMHPMAVIEQPLREHLKTYGGVWDDFVARPFPWPTQAVMLWDAVAFVCQRELRGTTPNNYLRMYDAVCMRIFGMTSEHWREKRDNDRAVALSQISL
jgi:hypothetical protein